MAFDIPNSRAIRCVSTAAVMPSSLAGVSATWTTSVHNCPRKHTSCLTKTLLRSLKHTRVWMTSTRITYSIYHRNRYPFDYYKYRRLRSLRNKSRLRVRWLFEHDWTLQWTVSKSTCNHALCYRDKQHSFEHSFPVWWWHVPRKVKISGHVFYSRNFSLNF